MHLHHQRFLGISLAILSLTSLARAADKAGLDVYGFAQIDYIQDFNRVNPAWQDTLRPSRIPTTDGQYGSDGQASLSPKQSKLGVQTRTPLEGSELYTKFEFDFFGVGVDEGQTTPRLRHAYGQWGHWLGGQTNSLFMDIDIFPNVIDYWGPCGMVFYRTPQIRWTPVQGDNMSLAIAIEKPGDDIDQGMLRTIDSNVSANLRADEKVPDLTAQWKISGGWGHVQLAGIVRQIGYETTNTLNHEPSDHKTGGGVDLTTAFNLFTKDKLILGVVGGQGIASYMNDGGTDLGPDGTAANLSSKLIPLVGTIAYYDHSWNDKWTTTLGFSQTEVQNSDLQTADAFNRGQYASINLLSTPQKNVMSGIEYLYGTRKSNDGTMNDDSRVQISMRYSFSSLDF
jgi:hypothetical protein